MSSFRTAVLQPVVLDTNVVLDLLVFRDPGVQAVARAIRSGEMVVVTTHACNEELRRVLAYPKLKLDAPAQAAALDCYLAQATLCDVTVPPAPAELPLCADQDDQKFLELAWHANARWLVTRDNALLALSCAVARLGRFAIVRPDAFGGRGRSGLNPDTAAFSRRTAPGPSGRAP